MTIKRTMDKKQNNLLLHSLTWFVILTQVTSSAAFADIKVFPKDTLAPQIVSDPTPPAGDTTRNNKIKDYAILTEIACRIGEKCLIEAQGVDHAVKALHNYPSYMEHIDPNIKITLDDYGIITIPIKGVSGQIRVCLLENSAAVSRLGGGYDTPDRFAVKIFLSEHPQAGVSDEPLIGHRFNDVDLENISITPWNESQSFSRTLDELEEIIKARAPNAVKDKLLETIALFRNASEGWKLGTIKSVYESLEKYYLGFGTKRSIGLAAEFFDPRSPLYEHRLEALFHEFFHAAFGRGGEYSSEHDTSTHLLAIQIAAAIFWKDMPENYIRGLTLQDLENHGKNKFGEKIRAWKRYQQAKSEQVDVPKAMVGDNWKYLLKELSAALKVGWESDRSVSELLSACDQIAAANKRHPVEARYPILRAVRLLSKKEKLSLVTVLTSPECADVRSKPVVDSILLMLKEEISEDWMSRQARSLRDRSVWVVSSEVWNAGGGLGRVEQSHSIGFADLLKCGGQPLKTCEPYYARTKNKKTGQDEETNYSALLGVGAEEIKEVARFDVPIGNSTAVAVCYMAVNKFGIESYLIKGYKKGQAETEVPYYTERLYHYRNPDEGNLVSDAEFSAFFSRASLELIKIIEKRKAAVAADDYRAPAIHFNDGQLGSAPLFRNIYYKEDPILGRAMVGYSTHTYPNRVWWDRRTGDDILRYIGIDEKYWKYFYHTYGNVVDLTSAGARTADWYAGVSAQHVDDILSPARGFGYDNHDEWDHLTNMMVSVTNGDVRASTAHIFRENMLSLFPDADVEEPTPGEVLATKRESKKKLGLREDQYVVSFTGRVVPEKASPTRAFSPENIEKMVRAGIQVVIGANVPVNPHMVNSIKRFSDIERDIARKKQAEPDVYKGSFTIIHNIDIEDQRAILAATDVQIQDSDPKTEAAGYSEADVGVCGGLQLAPPLPEGILQSQGVPINLDIPGEGNTIIPKDNKPESYFTALMAVLEKTPEEVAKYQATAVKLSGILEARLTSAEYLRQWNAAVERKEVTAAAAIAPNKDLKGPKAPDSNTLISDLIASGKMFEVTIEDGVLKAYQVRYVNGYKPGATDPNECRGPPAEITRFFSEEESANVKNWLNLHRLRGSPIKFRIVLGEAAIGWNNDIAHSNIAHAGYRDGAIYIGEKLLKRIFQRNSERLCKTILEDDELAHLTGKDHGPNNAYKERLKLVSSLIRNIEARETAKLDILLNKIAALPIVRDALEGTPEEKLAALRALVIKTNEDGYYHKRGEAGLSIMLSGDLGKLLGLRDKDLPLYYTITASENGDFSALNALKEATDLARDMSFKNPLAEVFFEGGKSFLYVDGNNYFAATAVYGDKDLFDRGLVVAKGGVRIECAQKEASPANIANVRRAVELYVKAFIDLGTLGVSRIEGPDMRPNYMDVGDIMELIDGIGIQAEKDLNTELIPLTTSGSAEKGYLSHDAWRVTSLSVLESICALLDNESVIKQFNIPTDKPRTIILQGLGEVGGNIIKLFLEHPEVYNKYNFRVVGVSDLDFGSIYNSGGIPLEEIGRLAGDKAAAAKRGERFVFNPANYEILGSSEVIATTAEMSSKDEAAAREASKRILFKDALIAIPAAKAYQIETDEDVANLKVRIFASAANAPIGKKTSRPEEVARIERLMLAKGIISQPSWLINYGGIATSKEEILHRFIEGGLKAMLEPTKRKWLKDHVTGGDVIDVAWVNTYWALYLWKKEGYARPLSEIMKERAYRIADLRKEILMSDAAPLGKLQDKLMRLDSATTIAKSRVMLKDLGGDTEYLRSALADIKAPLAVRRVAANILGKSGNPGYASELLKILEEDSEPGVMYRNAAAGLGYILGQYKAGGEVVNRIHALYDRVKYNTSEGSARERKIWLEWLIKKSALTDTLSDRIKRDIEAIGRINKDLVPPVKDSKVIYHIIPEALVPHEYVGQSKTQRTVFSGVVKRWNDEYPDSSEKIVVVTEEEMRHPEKMIEKIKLREMELTGRDVLVDIALDDERYLDDEAFMSKMPKDAKFLVFKAEGGRLGTFRQLEGILAGLRALYINDYSQRMEKLSRIYELLTGAPPSRIPDVTDSGRDFARKFIFVLPPIEVRDPQEFATLNGMLIASLSAA
ncbi:MAG: glycogen/starch synthase [Candidatus Omnitrophica bacterium]|nr:glycogen/starch synthase [Candidatus Omnitrophota bacterium]